MRLENVTKKYGSQLVLDNLTLEIAQGEILCVLGASGCGKTTLLNILAGLTSFDGRMEGGAEKPSYIFQEHRLLPNLSVFQNVQYVGGDEQKAERLFKRVQMWDKKDKRPSKLSGGEKQRAAIVRAFSVDFDLLLMDEPFSSLDTALKIRLLSMVAELWSEERQNRRAVFVTHDIEEALMIADRIVVLKEGKIAFDEHIDRTLTPRAYAAETPLREKLLSALMHE